MDYIERKARSLARDRHNRSCETCKHLNKGKCEVVPDLNNCIYNDMEYWQPKISVFLELAEKVLER